MSKNKLANMQRTKIFSGEASAQHPLKTITGHQNNQAIELPVDNILPDSNQPRKTFSNESIEHLSASIKEKGLLQPISVRPNPGQDGKFILVMGERRWRAHKHAQIAAIRAFVIPVTDPNEAYELALIENVQREDLNPLEEAEGVAEIIKRKGYNQRAAGKIIGRSETQVSQLLKLNEIPDPVKEKLSTSKVSRDQLFQIAAQSSPEIMLKLHDKIVKLGLNVRETREAAKELVKEKGEEITKKHPLISKLQGFEKTIIKARMDEIDFLKSEDRTTISELLEAIRGEVEKTQQRLWNPDKDA